MGQILLGIIIAAAGVGYAVYMFRKSKKDALEMQYLETTSIADAIDLYENMEAASPNYRHYVELKGVIHSEEPVMAPFSGRSVAYYRSRCYCVNEETRTVKDSNGNVSTKVVKKEELISDEKCPARAYIKDQSSNTPVYIEVDSFGSDADLQSGCDRFESQDSAWAQRNGGRFDRRFQSHSGLRFLGYRLKEDIMNLDQPVYVLGELYRNGDRFYIGKSIMEKNASKFSYKSEEELVEDTKKKSLVSLVIGAGAVIIGIFMVVSGFAK